MSRPDALFAAACALGLVVACDRANDAERTAPDAAAEAAAESAPESAPRRVETPQAGSAPATPAPAAPTATTELPDTLPMEPESPDFPLPRLSARGNEPFWAIDVDGTVLLWKTPENPDGKALASTRRMDAGGLKFSGDDEGQSFELDLRAQNCQDTMSGANMEFTATWTYGGVVQSGCAERGR